MTTREARHDRRSGHPLPRPRPPLADRRLGRAAERRAGHGWPARGAPASGPSSCPRCSRRRSWPRNSSSTARSSRAPSTSPRRSTTSRRSRRFVGAADRYLASLERVKAQASVPIIASLNASTRRRLGPLRAVSSQDAGADALELNLYRVAADPRRTAVDMEAADLELVAAVRAAVTIPLAVKLSPYYSALANFAAAAVEAGRGRPRAVQSLLPAGSRPRSARGRAAARAEPALGAAAADPLDRDPATPARPWRVARGNAPAIQSGTDVVKGLMVGADVVMMTSALLRHGPEHVAHGRGRAARLDGRARVRVGRTAARKRQPGNGREPVRVRTRQLHADAPVMGGAERAHRDRAESPGRPLYGDLTATAPDRPGSRFRRCRRRPRGARR